MNAGIRPVQVRSADALARVEPLLTVERLSVEFPGPTGDTRVVQDVSLSIASGETHALVGESGSGKTITAMAILDLVPFPGRRTGGTFVWRGKQLDDERLRDLRGRQISMVFQDPCATLNPLMTVGRQIAEVLRKHSNVPKREANARAVELLDITGVSAPEKRVRQFPFELSGGMAQRVMIAIALAAEPDLLIADEPTSALDVTIQAQILELLATVQGRLGLSVLLITHDLGVVAQASDRVTVMYAGQVMEQGDTPSVMRRPRHPYTSALMECTPRLTGPNTIPRPIPGSLPALGADVPGCRFADRCERVEDACRVATPRLIDIGRSQVACRLPNE